MIDQTMKALLGVHRTEVNELEQRNNDLERQADSLQLDLERIRTERDNLVANADRLRKQIREQGDANLKMIQRKDDIIASLKIELADARAAATKAREGKTKKQAKK